MSEDEARAIIESGQDLENFEITECKQEINEIENSQKTEDVPIQESQIRTVSDMIDQMTSQYSKDLPKDVEKRISYIYPLDSTHSFHIVAVNHIKHLRYKHTSENRYVEIEEIDWSQLSNIDWNEKRSILLHPFLYPFASVDSFMQNSKNFARLLAMKNKIGGFDVADSNRISKPAVDLINKIDLMMVPSNFVKETYVKSGVTIPIEVLPHGISDKFSSDGIVSTDNEKIMKLRKMRQKGKILILYFLVHSPHRKGADLVKRVMKRIQKEYDEVYLVVRTKRCDFFSEVRSICIDSWLSDNDLVALYDSCDICLSPSRGGGFELNALEAVSRGVPTLVPNGGCFTDLMDYFIPVDLSDKVVQPLPGNTIHTGSGCQVNMDDFEDKLKDTINRLDYWKERSKSSTKEIREKYSWMNTAKMLDEFLKNHGFIE
jgi:glycosyltransferase involved in cell wall biosynthesis